MDSCPFFLFIFDFFYIISQDWHGYVDGLESFSHRHGYDALVGLLSTNDTVHHPRQQVAVYSNNTNLLNQVNHIYNHQH